MGRELTPNRIASFTSEPCDSVVLRGISTCFQVLSPCLGQIAHALLTRPPLEYQPSIRKLPIGILVRLACVKHAASVRPEPGSNSDVQSFIRTSKSLRIKLAKARSLLPKTRRFTLRILTVKQLVQIFDLTKLVCLWQTCKPKGFPTLYCLVFSRCIVFKVRSLPFSAAAEFIIPNIGALVKSLFHFF